MTKKNYEAAAKLIRSGGKDKAEKQRIACFFATFFQQDNVKFDRERFVNACLIEVK